MSDSWLDQVLPLHRNLTQAVVSILQSVLQSHHVEFLSVTGRTKDRESAVEKIRRKGYQDPKSRLTDLSGIRVVAFSESDVKRAAALIESTFEVDRKNSLDQDTLLAANQLGYRSVHYVCELGTARASLPEFAGLAGLKFEIQLRTVLQHAWAELSHDRSYKFAGKLPREIERRIFLYAGMLEIADRGFDELARELEVYANQVATKSDQGEFTAAIDSVSLPLFVDHWSKSNAIELLPVRDNENLSEIVKELTAFGLGTLADLKSIEPRGYVDALRQSGESTNIYGLLRDWMLISNWRKVATDVPRDWVIPRHEEGILEKFIPNEEWEDFRIAFSHTR
jgi:ppGpp synthetase/RelA/SpoT-type nucleotidyltranferase